MSKKKYSIKELIYFVLHRLPRYIIGRYVRKNLVKVHWGRGLNNFGDCLQPDTLKHYGLMPVYVPSYKKADIVMAGTILNLVSNDYAGFIIGTGGKNKKYEFPNAKVLAVRGKFTNSNIKNVKSNIKVALGDLGLLAKLVYPMVEIKNYKLGIIFHFDDANTNKAERIRQRLADKNVLFIDVLRSPQAVVSDIKQCEAVVSTSLHGLIIADSFGIPNSSFGFRIHPARA